MPVSDGQAVASVTEPSYCPAVIGAVDVQTVVFSTVVSVAVSVVVTGSLKSTGFRARERWTKWRDARRVLSEGDHATIGTGSPIPLGPGTTCSRVGVRVAPAVRFDDNSVLDPDAVERWLVGIAPILVTYRDYCDPTELVRYRVEDFFAAVHVNGYVEVCVPVSDTIDEGPHGTHQLHLASVVDGVVPIVVSLCDGGFEAMFPGRLRSARLDWRFDVSRDLNTTTYGQQQRVGLIFPGREPASSTPGQQTPNPGPDGFGGQHLRNLPLDTDPVEIVSRFLSGLIERSGYTGNTEAMQDLRVVVTAQVRQARDRAQSPGA